MFLTSTNKAGSWGVVLENADGACWFYLCRIVEGTPKIASAIHIASSHMTFTAVDVSLQWDPTESKAALSIENQIWAVFDTESMREYGGDYQAQGPSSVPSDIAAQFGPN